MRIGLTGGIGSGKSTVAGMLAGLGAMVVDTDAIARALTLPGGGALPALVELFGAQALDASGALDRDRMRQIVFTDPDVRRRLEGVLHPMILAECERQAAQALIGQCVVFDVPLLVESGHWRSRVDKVLVIDCRIETQMQRVIQRSGWTEAEVRRVIDQQASREQRTAVADAVIFNDGLTLAALEAEVQTLWRTWAGVA